MNNLEGQEVKFPVVMPKELWDLSGRYSSIGSEMVLFHYLSKKQYEAHSKEDREKYDKEKAEYEEKKEKYIGQNSAASITL